jgi:hypothetical protein
LAYSETDGQEDMVTSSVEFLKFTVAKVPRKAVRWARGSNDLTSQEEHICVWKWGHLKALLLKYARHASLYCMPGFDIFIRAREILSKRSVFSFALLCFK